MHDELEAAPPHSLPHPLGNIEVGQGRLIEQAVFATTSSSTSSPMPASSIKGFASRIPREFPIFTIRVFIAEMSKPRWFPSALDSSRTCLGVPTHPPTTWLVSRHCTRSSI